MIRDGLQRRRSRPLPVTSFLFGLGVVEGKAWLLASGSSPFWPLFPWRWCWFFCAACGDLALYLPGLDYRHGVVPRLGVPAEPSSHADCRWRCMRGGPDRRQPPRQHPPAAKRYGEEAGRKTLMKSLVASRAAVCSPTARELPGLKIGGAAGRSQNLEALASNLTFWVKFFGHRRQQPPHRAAYGDHPRRRDGAEVCRLFSPLPWGEGGDAAERESRVRGHGSSVLR